MTNKRNSYVPIEHMLTQMANVAPSYLRDATINIDYKDLEEKVFSKLASSDKQDKLTLQDFSDARVEMAHLLRVFPVLKSNKQFMQLYSEIKHLIIGIAYSGNSFDDIGQDKDLWKTN